MKRFLLLALCLIASTALLVAQNTLKKVYDETIDPMEQIDKAVAQAKTEGKIVICQVGGNWCPWCLRFADFAEKNAAVKQVMDENFVYIHVNYNPRKAAGEAAAQKAAKLMNRLSNPQRFGFPVFVLLDSEGKVIHIQDSSFLEEGQGYDESKTLRFLKCWTAKAVNN